MIRLSLAALLAVSALAGCDALNPTVPATQTAMADPAMAHVGMDPDEAGGTATATDTEN